MGALNKIQALEFRTHHERAWPLDYWLHGVLPIVAALWGSFGLAALANPGKDSGEEQGGGFVHALNTVQTFLVNQPTWTVGILAVAALGWVLVVFAPWLPALWQLRVSRWQRAGAEHPLLAAGGVMPAVLIAALALSSLRIMPSWWGWWLALTPLLAWGWWSFRAFRLSDGPMPARMVIWRIVVIVFLVTGGLLLCLQTAPEKKADSKPTMAGSLAFDDILKTFSHSNVPESAPVPPTPETRATDRKMPKVVFYEPPPNSPPASPAVSPSPSPPPRVQFSRRQKHFLLELLELFGQGIFGFGSGGSGGSGVTIDVGKAVEKLNSDPSKRAAGLQMLRTLVEANPGNQELAQRVGEIIAKVEPSQIPTTAPPPPAAAAGTAATPAASVTPSASPVPSTRP